MTVGRVWTIRVNSTQRKWKDITFERKLDMNSPTKFTAKIEYATDIDFMDKVDIFRDGVQEWAGFVENMKIVWDESGRYLIISGRDGSLLLWKKYVEDFSNFQEKTAGFFGQVNISNLLMFMLRSPASDPIHDSNGNVTDNKEGWGIDSTTMSCDAARSSLGNPNWAILRRRAFGWRNSGGTPQNVYLEANGINADINTNWEAHGSTPYVNDSTNVSYVNSRNNKVGYSATIDLEDAPVDYATLNSATLYLTWKAGVGWWWATADVLVYAWIQSQGASGEWQFLFRQTGRTTSWSILEWDLSPYIKDKTDIDNLKIKILNNSSNLETYIGYTRIALSYINTSTQAVTDYFTIRFPSTEVMGIYFESRMDNDSYPRNYSIVSDMGDGSELTLVTVTGNTYRDIIHSWHPVVLNNLKIKITSADTNNGWSISQVYVYKTQTFKYRVYLDNDAIPVPTGHYDGGPWIEEIVIGSLGSNELTVGPVNVTRQRLLDAINFILQKSYDQYYNTLEWWITPNYNNTFNIAATKGSDLSATIVFQTGINTGSATREKFIDDTVQRVYVVGQGEQKKQQESSTWVESTDGMDDVNTFYEEVEQEKSLSPSEEGNPAVAEIVGEVYMKKNATRRDQIVITINNDYYESMTYDVGDIVTVIDQLTATNGAYRIQNIDKNISESGEILTITLGYPKYRYEDEITNIYKQLKMLGTVGVIKPDWTVDGIDQKTINADQISTRSSFEKSAKNDEIDAQADIQDPRWFIYPQTDTYVTYGAGHLYQSGSYSDSDIGHGMEFRRTNAWLCLLGPNDSGIGWQNILVAIQGNMSDALDVLDIPLNRDPKITCEIKCYELSTGGSPIHWTDGDYFSIGIRNVSFIDGTSYGKGYWFKGYKFGSTMTLYAVACPTGNGDSYSENLIGTISMNHKYKLEIIVESDINVPTNATITFNVYDMESLTSKQTVLSGAFRVANSSSILVKPLFMSIYGNGSTPATKRTQLFIYKFKTEWLAVST